MLEGGLLFGFLLGMVSYFWGGYNYLYYNFFFFFSEQRGLAAPEAGDGGGSATEFGAIIDGVPDDAVPGVGQTHSAHVRSMADIFLRVHKF